MTPQPVIHFLGPSFGYLKATQVSLNLIDGAPPMMTCSSSTSHPPKKRSRLTHVSLYNDFESKADNEVYFPEDVIQEKKKMEFMVHCPTPKWTTSLPYQKTLFKSLYVSSNVPYRSLKLSLNIQLDQNGPFLNLTSEEMKVISKPSKKKGILCNSKDSKVIEGDPFSLKI